MMKTKADVEKTIIEEEDRAKAVEKLREEVGFDKKKQFNRFLTNQTKCMVAYCVWYLLKLPRSGDIVTISEVARSSGHSKTHTRDIMKEMCDLDLLREKSVNAKFSEFKAKMNGEKMILDEYQKIWEQHKVK